MIKTAIFVEGQSELIFTRELLLKYFEYQNIWIECYNLLNDQNLNPTEHAFPNTDAEFYFQILNIGNDQKVISSILKREKYLFSENQGFHRIIGLRDMYSKEYKEKVKNSSIDLVINERFIKSHQKTIEEGSLYPEKIFFHFAIMELESWLLSFSSIFERLHKDLNYEKISDTIGVDLRQVNPESSIFHPATLINKILQIIGDAYDKKKGEVNKFLALIGREDIINLLESEKCPSFNSYCESLTIKIRK
jgi:hypothetical protein